MAAKNKQTIHTNKKSTSQKHLFENFKQNMKKKQTHANQSKTLLANK